MIKKSLLAIATLATIAAGSLRVAAYTGEIPNRQPQIYPDTFVIDEVNEAQDLVIGRTFSGLRYAFYGTEDWMVGDIAAVIMSDNGTEDTVLDDIVITARYVGYTDEF